MFIRKPRYEEHLQAARLKGRREGRQEAVEMYHDMVMNLENENATLRAGQENARKELDHAYSQLSAMQKLLEQKDALVFKKSDVIGIMAKELACCQKMADKRYYEDGDKEASSMLLMQAMGIKDLASELGICSDVYAQAIELYDFRKSGKEGYTLKDGKIVKVEEPVEEVQCPFLGDDESQNPFPDVQTTALEERFTCDPEPEETTVCDPDAYLIREVCEQTDDQQ